MSENQSYPLIYAAMSNVMKDVDAVGKDKKNQQQGFSYRGIDDVYNALNQVMAKHGVFTTSEIYEEKREERVSASGKALTYTMLKIRYTFWALDGSNVQTEILGEGMDSGDKSSNKAMAIAHKYALLQAFCIPTVDLVDPDSQTHELQPKKIDIGPNQPNTQAAADYVAKQKLAAIEAEKKQAREPGDESEHVKPAPQKGNDPQWSLINEMLTKGSREAQVAQLERLAEELAKLVSQEDAARIFDTVRTTVGVQSIQEVSSLMKFRKMGWELYKAIQAAKASQEVTA